MELRYPNWRKGKSSSEVPLTGEWDMLYSSKEGNYDMDWLPNIVLHSQVTHDFDG